MNKITNVTIGTDPELFIQDSRTNKIISSIGIIPGKKKKAYVPKGFGDGFGLQIDNILAEFKIPPVTNVEDFISHIRKMTNYIDMFVKEINPDYRVHYSASEIVEEDQLQSDEAKLFGCEPDFNAYTADINPKPEGEKTNLRSAGEVLAR